MSFWTTVARPAVIMGGASIASSLASVAFPQQATLFQTLSTLFAGATLHAVNPGTSGMAKVSVTSTNPDTNKVTQTVAQSIPVVEPVQEVKPVPVVQQPVQQQATLSPDQIALIVAQTIAAMSQTIAPATTEQSIQKPAA